MKFNVLIKTKKKAGIEAWSVSKKGLRTAVRSGVEHYIWTERQLRKGQNGFLSEHMTGDTAL